MLTDDANGKIDGHENGQQSILKRRAVDRKTIVYAFYVKTKDSPYMHTLTTEKTRVRVWLADIYPYPTTISMPTEFYRLTTDNQTLANSVLSVFSSRDKTRLTRVWLSAANL